MGYCNDFTFIRLYFEILPQNYGSVEDFYSDVLSGKVEFQCNMYGSLERLIYACQRALTGSPFDCEDL